MEKPKNEFTTDPPSNAPNYLGEDFYEDLKQKSKMTHGKFVQHLLKMRQSVIDKFEFKIEDRVVQVWIDRIYKYYEDNFEAISNELNGLSSPQNAGGNNGG